MSLLVIDFTYLEGRDRDIVVKELAAVYFQTNGVASYLFKRPYGWEEVPMFNARINEAIDHGCNWNYGDVLYSELETLEHREASSAVAINCFGPQETQFISGIIERTFIDITQLGCPSLPGISLPAISCTFTCHSKSKHICALRTAYTLTQWLNFHILTLQYAKCSPQAVLFNVFQMTAWGLLRRTYYLNEQQTKFVSIYLNDDNLKPEVKIGTPCHAVLNELQLFILVTLKSDMPKSEVHELGDPHRTLSVYCGLYIRISSENTQVLLIKIDWSQLLNLVSAYIDKEVIKYGRLQEELAEWRNKCFESKLFCTPPDINVIDFNKLWNELKYKNTSLSDEK